MPALRDFVGSACPSCRHDILQAAPSKNRMPGEEAAWCPSCDTKFSVDQLSRKVKPSIMKRLFGSGPSNA